MGLFIGATAAFFWDYVNVFVMTFFRNGIDQLRILSSTGHVPRPESLISVPAWFGNLALILDALLFYLALPRKQWSDGHGRHRQRHWGVCDTGGADTLLSQIVKMVSRYVFLDGDRLSADHRLIDGAVALKQNSIDWNLLARSDS